MDLGNNFKDIYGIVLKNKIDSQNLNLKVTLSQLFKISCNRAYFKKKSDFDFFNQTLKLTLKFLKSFLNLPKAILNGP